EVFEVGGGCAGRERELFAEVVGGFVLRDAGDDVGGAAAVAEFGGGGGPGGVGVGGREPVGRWCVGVVAPGGGEGDKVGPVGGAGRGDGAVEDVVHVDHAAAGGGHRVVVPELDVGEA